MSDPASPASPPDVASASQPFAISTSCCFASPAPPLDQTPTSGTRHESPPPDDHSEPSNASTPSRFASPAPPLDQTPTSGTRHESPPPDDHSEPSNAYTPSRTHASGSKKRAAPEATNSTPPTKKGHFGNMLCLSLGVGYQRQYFYVYDFVFEHSSEAWRTAVSRHQVKKDQTMDLPDIDASYFKTWVAWNYSAFNLSPSAAPVLSTEPGDTHESLVAEATGLCIIAAIFEDKPALDFGLRGLIRLWRDYQNGHAPFTAGPERKLFWRSSRLIRSIYKHTKPDSRLRLFVAQSSAREAHHREVSTLFFQGCEDFCDDVLQALCAMRRPLSNGRHWPTDFEVSELLDES